MSDTRPLEGQVALVTGAGQGIGLAIASALIEAGASVGLVDVDQSRLDAAVALLTAEGGSARGFQADLSDGAAAADVPKRVAAEFGRLDIAVNNAGRRGIYGFLDYPLDDWESTFALNLTAPFLICREAGRIMVAQGGGSIVNITSTAANLAFRSRSAYNASKAGLVMLTKSIALELGYAGVRCNAVSPGVVETPLNAEYLRDSPITPIILEGTPVGHWGQPENIAAPVVFLCTEGAQYINGAVIPADGGWLTGKGY